MAPPAMESSAASVRKTERIWVRRLAPRALRRPISSRSLRDRDEHDVHDADARDHDRDAADARHRHGERVEDPAQGIEDGLLADDGDVLFVVAIDDDVDDLLLHELRVSVDVELDEDAEEGAAVEEPHHRRHGCEDHLVHVLAHLLAPLLEDADHPHARVADPDHLSDGVGLLEELLGDRVADDRHRSAAVEGGLGQELGRGGSRAAGRERSRESCPRR